ncbi:MAG: hypothetical protein RL432_388 [Bacteroidota bacterium]|jgi:hypothetical protein|nr:hypothetical protein [Flavobacteriia bacterium]
MKFYSSCLALFLAFSFLSQSSIEFNFNEIYIGSNLGVNWKRHYPNLSFSTGLTYHINRIDQIPIGTFIKNSAFAENFGQRFGLQLGFEYYLYNNDFFKIGLFYSNQISLMNQLIKVYSAYDTLVSNPQSEFDFLYTKYERIYGPVFTSDNVIGITLKNNITKNIYLSTRGGLGILFWKNTDNSLLLIGGNKINQSYNFTSFFSIGIGYTFNKKEK